MGRGGNARLDIRRRGDPAVALRQRCGGGLQAALYIPIKDIACGLAKSMVVRALTLLGPVVLIRGVSRTRADLDIFERPAYTLGQRETLFADDAIRLFPKRLKGAHNHTFGNGGSQREPGLPPTGLKMVNVQFLPNVQKPTALAIL